VAAAEQQLRQLRPLLRLRIDARRVVRTRMQQDDALLRGILR
jgi:hypothetical protein